MRVKPCMVLEPGVDLAQIMEHVGWNRRHTALYYMQLAKVLHPEGASAKLASLNNVANPWQDANTLTCAFPTGNLLEHLEQPAIDDT